MVGGLEQHTRDQVGVSPQFMNALLCGRAVHFNTLSGGTQEEPALTPNTIISRMTSDDAIE